MFCGIRQVCTQQQATLLVVGGRRRLSSGEHSTDCRCTVEAGQTASSNNNNNTSESDHTSIMATSSSEGGRGPRSSSASRMASTGAGGGAGASSSAAAAAAAGGASAATTSQRQQQQQQAAGTQQLLKGPHATSIGCAPVKLTTWIPTERVGMLVGRSGANVAQLKASTDTRIATPVQQHSPSRANPPCCMAYTWSMLLLSVLLWSIVAPRNSHWMQMGWRHHGRP